MSQGGPIVASAALSQPAGDAQTGSTLQLLLSMSEGVTVTGGPPTFTLNDGATATYDPAASNPSSGTLAFDYTVGSNDSTANLAVTEFNANGATIQDANGNSADFSALLNAPTGVSVNSPLAVTSVSTSQSGEAAAGQTVQLTLALNEAVTVNTAGGAPTLTLDDGATATYDANASNPSAGNLVFDYTVGSNDVTPNLSVFTVNLPTGTTVRDASGNNADFSGALNQNTGLQIGPAFVNLVAPSQAGNVSSRQAITLTVTMSEGVIVDTGRGSPTLTLNDGGTASYDANASNPSSGTLVFDYTVGTSDYSANLAVTGVILNGATVQDANGVGANFAWANLPLGLEVNAAVVTAVTPSQTGEVDAGAAITLTLAMSSGVTINTTGGSPTLTLDDGATATYDANASNPSAGNLVFDYTVAATDESPNLTVARVNLNGATIVDANGNPADLSGAPNLPTSLQVGPAFITAVTPSQSGEADTGHTVTLTLALSQGVTLDTSGGPPTLTLNDGATATYDANLSNPSSGTLAFDYTVGANDYVSNLEVASVNLPSGTTIEDAYGVNVDFSGVSGVPPGLQINSSFLAGNVTVSSGDSVAGVTAPNGVELDVLSGGTTSGTAISGGVQDVFAGGTTTGTTVASGGSEFVSSGGTAIDTVVLAGGSQNVLSGGTADYATISGGSENVSSGGTDNAAVVANGGTLTVLSGGVSNYEFVSGGSEVVSSGATASVGVVISGQEIVDGFAFTTWIGAGGSQYVSSGGVTDGTTVDSGGFEIVSSGGTASGTTVDSGGTMEIASGGIVSGAITFGTGSGTLQIDSATSSTLSGNTVSGVTVGDAFDLRNVPFDSAGTAVVSAGNVLHIVENSNTYNLQLGSQDFSHAHFLLTSDGHGGTDVTDVAGPYVSGLAATASFTEEGAATTLSPSLSVADTNGNTLVSATVSISGGAFAGDGDVLATSTTGPSITASYNSTAETLTLTGTDTLAHYQQVLDAVTFSAGENPTNFGSNPTRTVVWTLNDGSGTANGGAQISTPVTSTISVTNVNDPPTLSNVASSVQITGTGQTVTVSPSASVSDPDSVDLASATVAITGGTFSGDGDVLAANTVNTSITASYNATIETLTLTGSDTLAHYQAVLDSVTFDSTSANPANSGTDRTRTVTWEVNDGSGSNALSAPVTTTISIVGHAVSNDFDGDGTSDVLWRNAAGEVDTWLMNNGQMAGGTVVSSVSSAWQFAGAGDITGNGTSDVVWQNTSTGAVESWLINNGNLSGGTGIGHASSVWQPLGTGDFNADGISDVLWRNTNTGEVDTWLLNNGQLSGGTALGSVSTAWQFAGIGDFTGTGTSDVLWHNTATGEVDTWLITNGHLSGGTAIGHAASVWQSLGTGDFNGDGTADVLWRNTNTGEVDTWIMNNGQVTGGTALGSVSSAWQFAGIGNFTGTGTSDILWRNTNTGEVDTWLITNDHLTGGTAISTASSAWQPQVIHTS
jgi:autotransporter passenger strand-loop-strand repeat protein